MKSLVTLFLVFCFALSSVAQEQYYGSSPLVNELSMVVKNLDKAEFRPVREGWQHDYGFGPGVGLLNTYEYLRSLTSFETFQGKLPLKIFIRGPHSPKGLKLTDKYNFGYYNPEFVKYFHAGVKQLLRDDHFISSTRGMMVKYGLIDKLDRLQEIYQYIKKNPAEFRQFKYQYERKLADRSWPEGGYRRFLPAKFDNSKYWNWVETVYYFWIRRDIDGTKMLWINVIDDVLGAYGKGVQ